MTQRERAAEARAASGDADAGARILEAIASGVLTLGPAGRIASFNRAAERTFGIAAERMLGEPLAQLARLIPEFPEVLAIFHEQRASQLRAEVAAQRESGEAIVLEVALAPLRSEGPEGVAVVLTDVTELRRIETVRTGALDRARRIEAAFSRYLAPHVLRSLLDDPGAVRLGGERIRATICFADVRGFTALAKRLPPERVVEILNAYFDAAVKVVFAHDGLLDKFYGDGLMAIFGAPRARADDAARATAAALELHAVVRALGPRLGEPLAISVGLASGEVVAGHLGSAERMDYTVIGDAVNRASGLQAAAPAGAVYADAATIAAAGLERQRVREVRATVKGADGPVRAYALEA